MRRLFVALLGVSILLGLSGCGNGVSVRTLGIAVSVSNAFSIIPAGSGPVTLTATLDDDPTNEGVTWTLSTATVGCSPGCGKLSPSLTDPKFSVVYTPPTTPPLNTTATITATSRADKGAVFVFNFTIGPALVVIITNKFPSQISANPAVIVTATVSNDFAKQGVTWTLTTGSPGVSCSPACGTLAPSASPSFSATYVPPPMAPSGTNDMPTITATSVTDPTKSDGFTFTIIQALIVTITNKFTVQGANGQSVAVNVDVIADPANAGVTWTLTAGSPPTNCSPGCGSLAPSASPSFSASYTPPPTLPMGVNDSPTITAISVTDPTKTDSFTFQIAPPANSFLGSYAFLLRGYDLNGSPMAMAGSVTSDGAGNITGGDLDVNNGGGLTNASSLMGNYSLGAPFNGVVRGTITITSIPGAGPVSFKFVLSSDGTRGKILELDGIGFINVGTLQRQDPAVLSGSPVGSYAFGLDSDSPVGGRTVEAGQIVLASTGVTGGLVDVSKAGDPTPRYSAAPLATGPSTAPDSSGRGTLTLNVNPPAGSASAAGPSSNQYAYYIVNSGQLNLIEIDTGGTFGTVQAGVARMQRLPFSATSVNTKSVLQLTGMDTIPGTPSGIGPDVLVGVLQIPNPNGIATTYSLNFDENDLGTTVISNEKLTAGLLSFDPTTGRGMLSNPNAGFGVGFVDQAVFYLNDVGQGFLIDADISTCVPGGPVCPGGVPPNNYPITNNAFSGTFTPQAIGPLTLSGNVIFSSGATAIPDIPMVIAAMTVDLSTSPTSYSAAGDLTSLNSPLFFANPEVGNVPNVTFSGQGVNVQDLLGHTLINLPQQIFGVFPPIQPFAQMNLPAFFYLIGPNQGVGIGTVQPQPGSPPVSSGVMFLDPL
jgi:hypothetical protein